MIYLVGIEYDDFCDGGFEVTAVCDTMEQAKKMKDETKKNCSSTKWDDIVIRPYKLNYFYEYYEIEE